MKKIFTMYEVTHKQINFIPKGRTPIFVGCGKNIGNYLSDNTGDNISVKNPFYCELTALYWIWKNDTTSNYVSIEHYRRFFMGHFCILSPNKISRILKKNDVVTSKVFKFDCSIYDYYKKNHYSEDIDALREIIISKYPTYLEAYDSYFSGHESFMLNMVACKKTIFDEYCSWLFDVLFALEKKIDIRNRDTYQSRVFGFISERLFNVWVKNQNLKTKSLNIFYLKKNIASSFLYSIYKSVR